MLFWELVIQINSSDIQYYTVLFAMRVKQLKGYFKTEVILSWLET